ncbi:rna-directed dna polymerase from transposon x-element [Penicillium digitatum]|uniref:Rna-directed dna polymerase from transposon x-element n=1 Tax=Penicillium digitatum TaxID=36651 RepID=A0A7T6XIT9_PENDI|nr:rna-directed dna polymerase from transposon x-element [Penicillium digitatum]
MDARNAEYTRPPDPPFPTNLNTRAGKRMKSTKGPAAPRSSPKRCQRHNHNHNRVRLCCHHRAAGRKGPVVLKQEDRLARKEPYAIRKQLESALKGVTPHTDIPKITRTATGWAITPGPLARPSLITEQGLNAIKDALNAHSVKVPQKWYNYAVPGVPPSIQAWDDTLIQTGSVIEDKVFAQTKLKPVSCRTSRHGASPTKHNITWVISFLSPVAPFTLFSRSSVARAILKKPQIQHHNPGCQSYCHTARCNRTPRCRTAQPQRTSITAPPGLIALTRLDAPTVTAHDLQGTLTAQSALLALRREHLASPPELRLINSDDTATDGIEMPTLHLLHHKTRTPPLRHPPARGKSPGSGRTVSKLSLGRPGKQPLKATSRGRRLGETTSPHLAPKSLSRHKKWTSTTAPPPRLNDRTP